LYLSLEQQPAACNNKTRAVEVVSRLFVTAVEVRFSALQVTSKTIFLKVETKYQKVVANG
jgi:hypothetical protein